MGSQKGIAVLAPSRRFLEGPRLARERIIAEAVVDVASELRLTDVAELINLIRNDQAANLADLVNSSTELYYKKGTLRYALSASFNAPWDATPEIALDLEFRHERVSAFFRLIIGRTRAGIEVADVLFDEGGLNEEAQGERLAAAFEGARLPAMSGAPDRP
jgi:hypothetical protein